MARDRGSNRKGKGECGRSKSRLDFRDLKKKQYTFCKELGHWKIVCSMIKDKNKQSKTEANLARVINTLSGSTSQARGSDCDSVVFSLCTAPTIGYSDDSEWMLDTGVTYQIETCFLTLREARWLFRCHG